MKASQLITLFALLAILAACGGQTGSTGMPGATAQARVHRATSGDLIYATGACGGTCVLSYPAGTVVQTLNVGLGGACADSAGNVYITGGSSLYEYAHGGATPINTFTVSEGEVNACSVEPTTGAIATTVFEASGFNVAIFANASSPPTTYFISSEVQYLGYDSAGNLFVDGYGKPFSLYELPKNGNSFTQISVSPSLVVRPGQVQWDGNYITIEGIGINRGVALYRLSVSGSTATVVGTTNFNGVTRTALQSWIQGDRIFIPYGSRGNGYRNVKVGVWKYPAGGKPLQKIKHFDKRADLQAVSFSPGTH